MGNSKFKEYFAPTVVLLVICLVASALLTGTYIMTKPIIAQREADAASGALAVVLPGGSDFAVMEDVTLVENVLEVQKAGNGEGFVVTASVGGYGGQVQSMVGINAAGEITGLQVMNHAETAGLGTKAFEEAYLGQFWGATSTDGANVIGGATYSSKAIIGAIDATILQFEVCNGASYDAPVQLTPEEQFAADCLEVLPGADAFTKLEGVTLAENALEVHKANNGVGMGVVTNGIGYNAGTPIKAVVGIDNNGAITGIKVTEHGETPGIGTRPIADEPTYIEQFIGATKITRGSSGDATKIDTISGATMTSVGVYDCAKAGIKQFEAMGGVI